jgi:hypothetical protein
MREKPDPASEVASALDRLLMSVNEDDRNGEPANVVDGLFAISRAPWGLARAVRDASGDAKTKAE